MTKRDFIRMAQAFNAMVKAAEIGHAVNPKGWYVNPFDHFQKEVIFDQLCLALSEMGNNFDRLRFADACGMN